MISKMDDGTVLLEMGHGTLYSSVVKSEGEVVGICFSNSKEGLVDGVVFSINSMQGIAGYVSPLISLFDEFGKKEVVGTEKERETFNSEIVDFKKFLEPFMPKDKNA